MVKKIALIVAAGKGIRMGSATPKQFLMLQDKPVLWHTIYAFQNAFEDMEILLVVSPEHFAEARQIRSASSIPENIRILAGGDTRFESVRNGLGSIKEDECIIFVHDGVRCLVTPNLIHRCFEKTLEMGNAIPAVAPVDSIRIETVQGNEPIDRDKVMMIQTPQTFYGHILRTAFQQNYKESFTDEAVVVEGLGVKINIVEGEPANIKITRPIDLALAERIFLERNIIY